MNIQLSDHFTFKKLLRFTLPSIGMLIFTSIYGIVDGFFVSNFVGKTPFAGVNFIMPLLIILSSFGYMFGAGGSAIIGKTLGEGDREKANILFSLFIYISMAMGIVISVLSIMLLPKMARLMGADGQMLEICVRYGRIILVALPFYMLQFEFQSFFITAEKPQLGFFVTVLSGVTNMVFDLIFVALLKWGVEGAALATAMSQFVGGVVPVIYFSRPNNSLLKFTKTRFNGKALLKVFTNGSSELITNISMALVGMLYNIQLLKYAGENGVAAYGVLMYVGMIFVAVFLGYSAGVAPVVSFHFGAQNHSELKSILRKSSIIIGTFSVAMFIFAELMAKPMSYIFVGYDVSLMNITARAFFIYSFSFLMAGFAIFGSGFFTALNDGLTSAVISFLRTIVFQVVAVLALPLIWELDGIWASVVFCEVMAVLITAIFLKLKQKEYNY